MAQNSKFLYDNILILKIEYQTMYNIKKLHGIKQLHKLKKSNNVSKG